MSLRGVCALAALSIAALASGCGGSPADSGPAGLAAQPSEPSTLFFVVNPSSRAHKGVFTNAREIVAGVARTDLQVVGIYEQVSSDDGPPFDRAFIQTGSPARSLPKDCSGLSTTYLKRKCQNENDAASAKVEQELAGWQQDTLAELTRIEKAGRTLESPEGRWNLRDALMRTGENLDSLDTPVRCVVLLGGLAVKQPPPQLPTGQLKGATLIAAGWRGTPQVQQAWRDVLTPAGAQIDFLPEAVTKLKLVPRVKSCLDAGAA
jgi:hypothetical protein